MVKEKNNKKDLMRGFLNTIKIDMNLLGLILLLFLCTIVIVKIFNYAEVEKKNDVD